MKNKIRIAPKATKGKGNRWRKGQSSNCNASTKKFRQQVNLMNPFSKNSAGCDDFEALRLDQLSVSGRPLHDKENMETKSISMDVDQESVGSCNTFASIYTNCTNVSFSKLMEQWNPSSLLHREMIAILATVTETIKEKSGTESETEYFAILVTLLETTEKEETLAAIAYLLSMVIKKLPEEVKKIKFAEISHVFTSTIVSHREKTNGYLLISLIRCLCELIKSQEKHVMKLVPTLEVYQVLLDLTLDSKPKIRRAAHRSIVSILKASKIVYENSEHHVLAPKTAEFCIRKIKDTSTDNINDALHMINLMKDIITILPAGALEECCITALRAMSIGNALLINGSLSVFLQLFSSSSPLRELKPDLNIKLINNLHVKCPSYTDSQLLTLWINVMKEGYLSLYSLDKTKCLGMLATFFNSTLPCFIQSDSKIVHINLATALQQIIQSILSPSLFELDGKVLSNIMDDFEKGLSFKYQNAWGYICNIIGTLMEHIGKQAPNLVSRFIEILKNLREGYNTKFLGDIDSALSKAIKFIGPEVILSIVPIQQDLLGSTQFAHDWLLPLLRDNIEKSELGIFKKHFVPLANAIEIKMKKMEKEKKAKLVKLYSAIYNQIWSLLPSFCRKPTDIGLFNIEFAKLINKKIMENANIRGHCLAALRNLITTTSEKELGTIKSFAKRYLASFFQLYTNPDINGSGTEDGARIYETARVYLTITNEEVRNHYCLEIINNLKGFDKLDENNVKTRNYLLDLLLLFIPYLKSAEEIKLIYQDIILPAIQKLNNKPNEKSSLKKVYRLVQEICSNEHCKEFISSLNIDVIKMLIGLFESSPDQIKYLPVNSISILCEKGIIQLEKKNINDILKVIIDCVATGRKKCKKAGFTLLINLPSYFNNNTTFVQQSLVNLISIFNKDLKPAEILVLGRGILELNQEELANDVRSKLFQFLDLLKNEQRSIVKAVFQILNLWIKTTNKEELSHSVYNIVISLNTLSENHKKAFRREVKIILSKLVRKFGYDMISRFVPEVYSKVLRNIRKLEARKARSKNSNEVDDDESEITTTTTHKSTKSMTDILSDDSDSDDLYEDDNRTQASSRRSKKKRSQTFIEERADEEEILDLMAPDINKRIHSSNPLRNNSSRSTKKEPFPMTEDGKLIIDFKDSRGSKRKRDDDDDVDEDLDENNEDDDDRLTMTNVSRTSKTSKSSKISKVSKMSKTSKASQDRASYKHGGKGIHRPIKKRKTGIKGVKTGEEFKAKKAGGDIKRKDGPDPFAYVPLNGALLNRRKKNKFKGYFNKLITSKGKSEKQN